MAVAEGLHYCNNIEKIIGELVAGISEGGHPSAYGTVLWGKRCWWYLKQQQQKESKLASGRTRCVSNNIDKVHGKKV